MTVTTTVDSSGPYLGAGQTGPFPITFRFLSNAHLQFVVTDAGGIESIIPSSGWTATGAGSQVGGAGFLAVALAVGYKLTINRVVPNTQETDYTQSDSFPAESHEDALDKLTMLTQQAERGIRQAFRVAGSTGIAAIPALQSRASTVVGFDANKNPTLYDLSVAPELPYSTEPTIVAAAGQTLFNFSSVVYSPGIGALWVFVGGIRRTDYIETSTTSITFIFGLDAGDEVEVTTGAPTSSTTVTQASNVAFRQPVTGSVLRNLQTKGEEVKSLFDFGAVLNGATDDTAAIASACAYASLTGFQVFHPGGVALVSNSTPFLLTKGGIVGWNRFACVISRADTTGAFFQLGDDAAAVFSCIGIRLSGIGLRCANGTASGQTPAIQVKNAYDTELSDLFLQDVGKAVWVNGNLRSTDVNLTDVRVAQSLVNEDCMQVSNGSSVVYERCKLYVHGSPSLWPPIATPLQTSGAAFAVRPIAGAQCDTVKVLAGCECLYFYNGFICDAQAPGSSAVNIWLDGTFDSCVQDAVVVTSGGTQTIVNINFGAFFWGVSWNGYGVNLNPAGICNGINFSGGRITQTGKSGLRIAGTATNIIVAGLTVDSNDRLALGNASAIEIGGTIAAFSITGCQLGGTSAIFPAQLAAYGVNLLSDIQRYSIVGNNLFGTIRGLLPYSHAAGSVDRRISDNVGDSLNLGPVAFTLPASTVAYTNKTGYTQDINIFGGTVTLIRKNATTITGMTSGTITLLPGETLAVTYSSAPSATAFQR